MTFFAGQQESARQTSLFPRSRLSTSSDHRRHSLISHLKHRSSTFLLSSTSCCCGYFFLIQFSSFTWLKCHISMGEQLAAGKFCGKHFHKFPRLFPVCDDDDDSPSLLSCSSPYRHVEIRCNFKYSISSVLRKKERERKLCLKHNQEWVWETWNWSKKEFNVHRPSSSLSRSHKSFRRLVLMQHNPSSTAIQRECRLPSTFNSFVIRMKAFFLFSLRASLSLVSFHWKFSRCFTIQLRREKTTTLWCEIWERYNAPQRHSVEGEIVESNW